LTANLRAAAWAASLLHIAVPEALLPEPLAGDINPIPGLQLIVRRRVAELHDLAIAHRQYDAAAIGRRRPAENDVVARRSDVQATRGDDAVEHRFAPLKWERAGRVHLAEHVIDLALPADEADVDRAGLRRLRLHRGGDNQLDLVDGLAGDLH